MVILSGKEIIKFGDLGDYGGVPDGGFCEFLDGFLRKRLLCRGVVIDRGTVLRADIVSLAVEGGGIVIGEEDLQKFPVGDFLRVEGDLDDLCMTGLAGANLFVGRVIKVPAGIARFDFGNSEEIVIDRFQAPETSSSKCGYL